MQNFGGKQGVLGIGDVQMVISPVLGKLLGIHKNKKDRRCMLIDIAVPSESNTSAKFTKKLSKSQDLEIEVNQGFIHVMENLESHGV